MRKTTETERGAKRSVPGGGGGASLFHISLLCAFFLACGAYEARAGSERLWHGEEPRRVTLGDVGAWIEEKWDLLFYGRDGRIETKSKSP